MTLSALVKTCNDYPYYERDVLNNDCLASDAVTRHSQEMVRDFDPGVG